MVHRSLTNRVARRHLNHESLESRQLLAADAVGFEDMAADDVHQFADTRESVPLIASVRSANLHSSEIHLVQRPAFSIAPFFGFNQSDRIEQIGDNVFAIDQDHWTGSNRLVVFGNDGDGNREVIDQIQIDFPIRETFVVGDRFYVLGERDNHDARQWIVTSFQVTGDGVESTQQQFDGSLGTTFRDDDHLIHLDSPEYGILPWGSVRSQDFASTSTSTLTAYRFGDDGLTQLEETVQIPGANFNNHLYGRSHQNSGVLSGDRFYFAANETKLTASEVDGNHDVAWPHRHGEYYEEIESLLKLNEFQISDSGISLVSSLNLLEEESSSSIASHLHLSDDGSSASIVRQEIQFPWVDYFAPPATLIDLVDLSGDSPTLFETVRLSQSHQSFRAIVDETAVFANVESVTLVNLDQSIDIDGPLREQMIDGPDGIRIDHQHLEVGDGRLIFVGQSDPTFEPVDNTGVSDTGVSDTGVSDTGVSDEGSQGEMEFEPNIPRNIRVVEASLLTFSVSQGEFLATTALDQATMSQIESLVPIDVENGRFGYIGNRSWQPGVDPDSYRSFTFGQLAGDGSFVTEGNLPADQWREVDANEDRLIARLSDRIVEYRWDDLSNPITSPLGQYDAPLQAVDDDILFVDQADDLLIDLLANDVIPNDGWWNSVRITKLIDAPEGFQIRHGRFIHAPVDIASQMDAAEFQYTITNGIDSSTATVRIDVVSITEQQKNELVAAAVAKAAIDLAVPESDFTVLSAKKVYERLDDDVAGGDPGQDNGNIVPSVLVELINENSFAVYSSNLNGDIEQVSVDQREIWVDLQLKAFDEAGDSISVVTEGEFFWIELQAEDLRKMGDGVYSAFIDLVVPTEHLEMVGPVEEAAGFTPLGEDRLTPEGLDEFGMIGNVVPHPGNEIQPMVRIGMMATAAGQVRLQTDPADDPLHETLLRGVDEVIPRHQVRFGGIDLTVVSADSDPSQSDPMDVNDSGEVTASDALQIINFLGRFGSVSLDGPESEQAMRAAGTVPLEMSAIRRLDANGNGDVSALDALVVINRLLRIQNAESTQMGFDDDEADPLQQPPLTVEGPQLF